jgi:hypothetical protein
VFLSHNVEREGAADANLNCLVAPLSKNLLWDCLMGFSWVHHSLTQEKLISKVEMGFH